MAVEPETDFVPDVRSGRSVKSTKTIIAGVVAVAVLCGFGGLIWYAYNEGVREGSESVAPLVIADKNPTRVRPESPGGMEVPFQDKQVYENLASGEGSTQVERLLPPPETPLPRPKPVTPEAGTKSTPDTASSSTSSDGSPAPDGDQESAAPASGQATVALAPPSPETPPAPAAPTTDGTSGAAPPVAPETAAAPEPPAPAAPKSAEAETTPAAGGETVAAATPAEIAAAPPTADPLSGAFLVQLSALKSAEAAQNGWRQIRAANEALLGQLSPNIQRAVVGDKGVFFRLRAGPLADRAAAQSLCESLAKRKVGCMVVRR